MIIMFFFGYKLELFPLMGMHTIGKRRFYSGFSAAFYYAVCSSYCWIYPGSDQICAWLYNWAAERRLCNCAESFAQAKQKLLFKHVSKNVLLPLITKLGMALPMLVTGAVITETIFSWPGIGPYFVSAVQAMDYPIVMSILVLSGTLVILGNLLSDILYCVTDPRIKSMK